MNVRLQKRRGTPKADTRRLRRRAERLLRALGAEERELSLLLTDDREMAALNRAWRGRARTTDVLAFSQLEGEGGALQPQVLGDVVISLPQAARQARARRATLDDELLALLVHGVLHLFGYDHEGVDRPRAQEMRRAQRRLIAELPRTENR